MNNIAYLSLGSNIENREENLLFACKKINDIKEIEVVEISSIYETDPVGYEDQDLFLNIAIKIKTSLSPNELLRICLEIEKEMKRIRLIRWGPRTIDIDILLYNDNQMETEELTIPHPRMFERAFVLIPLAELSTFITVKKEEVAVHELLSSINDKGVRVWKRKIGVEELEHIES